MILLLSAYGAVVQFMPVLVAALYWRRATGAGALAGMVTGGLVSLLFVLLPEWRPLPMHAGLYGVVANACVLVGVSLATSPSTDADAFVRDAAGD